VGTSPKGSGDGKAQRKAEQRGCPQPSDVVEPKRARTRPTYADAEIERGLLAVAAANGDTSRAARFLEEHEDLAIDPRTLWRWSRQRYVDRYQRVRADVLPVIRKEVADDFIALIRKQVAAARKLTDQIDAKADAPENRDRVRHLRELASANKDMGIASGISKDKAQLLDDQPTQIVGQRSFQELKRSLEARGARFVHAEVVEETTIPELPSG
jgi:hypothetical protein